MEASNPRSVILHELTSGPHDEANTRTAGSKKAENKLSSIFTKLKIFLYLGRKQKPLPKLPRDQNWDVSYATSWIRFTAALAMNDVLIAQAGEPTTKAILRSTANYISTRLRAYTTSIGVVVDKTGLSHSRSRSVELCHIINITSRNLHSLTINSYVEAETPAYRVRGVRKSPQASATKKAIAEADINIKRAVADVIRAHINLLDSTIKSVRYLKRLLMAITDAACEEIFKAANTSTFEHPYMNRLPTYQPPPPLASSYVDIPE